MYLFKFKGYFFWHIILDSRLLNPLRKKSDHTDGLQLTQSFVVQAQLCHNVRLSQSFATWHTLNTLHFCAPPVTAGL